MHTQLRLQERCVRRFYGELYGEAALRAYLRRVRYLHTGHSLGSVSVRLSQAMQAYQRYATALLRKAERILQNRADAQDVVQSLFVELLQTPQPREDFAYLYRAVTNRCLNLIRDQATRARLLREHDILLRGPVRTTCETRSIDLELLTKLVAALDEAHAEVLICHYFDDMSQVEIAELLGTSRKTVGVRLSRIRAVVAQLVGSGQPRGEA
jgi:RNA polymerase sigma factor (sigma-70 family)